MKQFLFLFLTTLILAGCTSYKNVPYLQNPQIVNDFPEDLPLYDAKIMPKDLLTITVNATDPLTAAPFNLTVQTSLNTSISTVSQPTLQQYLVDNEGMIDFPVLGRLHVGGCTKREAEQMIQERLKAYIVNEQPIVTVRMANYKISVLGEVNRPGSFTVSNEKVNVLEALAMAGDMTIYGVRDDVKLIREDAEGKREIINLNLTNAGIVTSPYYYLKQNDIIYVKPNKVKAKNSDIGNTTSLWLNMTSILVSIASLMATIFIK
ncbi:polysaccharide biosynthesis/export family protein [Bacteroides gallinaceum]|uniref:polysaccharide biosynthesis/export family protein n=1 Tax=Bacteroides gallinaceum TaxID=1462571 RepID=UPI0025AA36CB|nr:polysaccharide biosynthesis/export family protein [Bacteroides gallinaceum]MDN0066381.1 polysaccharide biosynthesis/export family protein [Bacteroides gallinaceum]